jgi:hypothetical protein
MMTNFLQKKGWYPHKINIETKDNSFKYVITVSLYYSIGTGEMRFKSKSMGFKSTFFL